MTFVPESRRSLRGYEQEWEPVASQLREGHVLSRVDLEDMLRENGGSRSVKRLIRAINSGSFSASTNIPLAILAITRRGSDIDVNPLSELGDDSKPRLYMDSRFPVEETDLADAALRVVTRDFRVYFNSQEFRASTSSTLDN